jgi:hypothetical protein
MAQHAMIAACPEKNPSLASQIHVSGFGAFQNVADKYLRRPEIGGNCLRNAVHKQMRQYAGVETARPQHDGISAANRLKRTLIGSQDAVASAKFNGLDAGSGIRLSHPCDQMLAIQTPAVTQRCRKLDVR